MPMRGGSIQKKLSWWGSAPRVAKILLMFALWSAYAIWTPKNPKLRFHICQKLSCCFCIAVLIIWSGKVSD